VKKLILISVLLALCVMVFPNVGHTLGFEGFGGKIGLIMPDAGDNTIGFGAIGDLGSILPSLPPLKAETSLEYWGNSYDYFGGSSSVSVISINGTAKYYFTSTGISPFAGAGLGFIISRASVKFDQPVFGISDSSTSETDIGINLVGGVDIPIGTGMKFVAEGKFSTGGVDLFQITGGIVVKLK
jgi:opacity protein-like surface antigen